MGYDGPRVFLAPCGNDLVNDIVCELYGLTDEEIEIVEEAAGE
ncbi:hypothetical protein ACFO0N_02465 [Halobium salinum]|uniref:Uncharacterized protein n=1 Tax=Halobium salinum TaxID=1364940 RepID=A0ABD5P7X9_9EURY|nr:hypothetical protein [Halobium salinum]